MKLRHGAFGDKSKSSSNKEASPDEPDKREETKQKNEAKARRNREKKRVQEVEDAKKKKEKKPCWKVMSCRWSSSIRYKTLTLPFIVRAVLSNSPSYQ